jgi:dTDP-4-amino-4,6-dideoxygalactose transaminase
VGFETLFEFERQLAEFTGAPYAVATDGCTHALELCLRYDQVEHVGLTPYTYLSIPQLLNQLNIGYYYLEHEWQRWVGEYPLVDSRIWDSARLLRQGMYRKNQLQCLSFGNGKPLQLGKGGAILTDSFTAYETLSRMRSDGRDLRISPWQDQKVFEQGYHYCPTLETCQLGIDKLPMVDQEPKYYQYPDLREVDFAR